MAHNVYECLFILDPNKYARDPGSMAPHVAKLVEDNGGEILANRLYVEQKLEYPIKGHRKGVYWLTYFRMESTQVREFEEVCRIDETVLRNLVIKVDPRLVEQVVAHARGETVAEPEAEGESSETPETASVGAGEGESS